MRDPDPRASDIVIESICRIFTARADAETGLSSALRRLRSASSAAPARALPDGNDGRCVHGIP
jgi:hypothetical protein